MGGADGVRGVGGGQPGLIALRTASCVVQMIDAALGVELGVDAAGHVGGEQLVARVKIR